MQGRRREEQKMWSSESLLHIYETAKEKTLEIKKGFPPFLTVFEPKNMTGSLPLYSLRTYSRNQLK